MADSPSLAPRVHEPNILGHEALADRLGKRTRIIRRHDFRLDLKEREQIVEIEGLASRAREARQKAFEQSTQTPERASKESEIADREPPGQGAPRDVGIRLIVADRADRCEKDAPECAATGLTMAPLPVPAMFSINDAFAIVFTAYRKD
jgi:hypothetical protein